MSEPKTFYERRGRRYYPVFYHDPEVLDALPQGAHLIVVKPGSMVRYPVEPDYAALIAAAEVAREAMLKALRECSQMQPVRHSRLSAKERKALEAYKRISGEDCLVLTRPSAWEIVQAGLDALIEAAKHEHQKHP